MLIEFGLELLIGKSVEELVSRGVDRVDAYVRMRGMEKDARATLEDIENSISMGDECSEFINKNQPLFFSYIFRSFPAGRDEMEGLEGLSEQGKDELAEIIGDMHERLWKNEHFVKRFMMSGTAFQEGIINDIRRLKRYIDNRANAELDHAREVLSGKDTSVVPSRVRSNRPFVGRERELKMILALSGGAVACVYGPEGSGRTELCKRALELISKEGGKTVWIDYMDGFRESVAGCVLVTGIMDQLYRDRRLLGEDKCRAIEREGDVIAVIDGVPGDFDTSALDSLFAVAICISESPLANVDVNIEAPRLGDEELFAVFSSLLSQDSSYWAEDYGDEIRKYLGTTDRRPGSAAELAKAAARHPTKLEDLFSMQEV